MTSSNEKAALKTAEAAHRIATVFDGFVVSMKQANEALTRLAEACVATMKKAEEDRLAIWYLPRNRIIWLAHEDARTLKLPEHGGPDGR